MPPPLPHMVRTAHHPVVQAEFGCEVEKETVSCPQGSGQTGVDPEHVPFGHDGRTHTGLE
ncbi:hypothetical protein O1M63_41225 [Streptomyces mirabilis]|nr:hypothetical protein [Streptomyces mirabilis]